MLQLYKEALKKKKKKKHIPLYLLLTDITIMSFSHTNFFKKRNNKYRLK